MGELEIFAIRIKELRESLKMTQTQFSDYVDIKQQTLSGYERGIMKPPLDIAKSIAEKCSVSIDWLCGLTEKKNYSDNISTYGDLLRLVIKITDKSKDYPQWRICFTDKYVPKNIFDDAMIPAHAGIDTEDKCIVKFFKDWKKIRNNLYEGVIELDLYQLWLNKKIEELDSMPIPENQPRPASTEPDKADAQGDDDK